MGRRDCGSEGTRREPEMRFILAALPVSRWYSAPRTRRGGKCSSKNCDASSSNRGADRTFVFVAGVWLDFPFVVAWRRSRGGMAATSWQRAAGRSGDKSTPMRGSNSIHRVVVSSGRNWSQRLNPGCASALSPSPVRLVARGTSSATSAGRRCRTTLCQRVTQSQKWRVAPHVRQHAA